MFLHNHPKPYKSEEVSCGFCAQEFTKEGDDAVSVQRTEKLYIKSSELERFAKHQHDVVTAEENRDSQLVIDEATDKVAAADEALKVAPVKKEE